MFWLIAPLAVLAQPAQPEHYVSYEQLTEHLLRLPAGVHPKNLNVLDQYALIPLRDSAVVHEYADADGYTWKVLEHVHDSATHEWMLKRAKTVMDNNGIRAYNAKGECVHSAERLRDAATDAADAEEREATIAFGIGMDVEMMHQPTENEVARINAAGGDIRWLPNGKLRWYFEDGGWEDTDFDHLYTEQVSLMEDGTPKTAVTLYRYAPEIGTKSIVPTERIEWYNTALGGGSVCAQRVVRTTYTNYTVHIRKGRAFEPLRADSALLAGIQISPNPVTGDVLQCNAPASVIGQEFDMLITDNMGVVYKRAHHSSDTRIVVPIAGLGTGTYSLCLQLPQFPAIRFFLKQ